MENWESLGLDMDMVEDFVSEATGGLDILRPALLHFELQPTENLNAVYRWVHTIKGTAGFLNLKSLQAFAHSFENFLQQIQGHRKAPHEGEVGKIAEGVDLLQDALEGLLQRRIELNEECEQFLKQLSGAGKNDFSNSFGKAVERLTTLSELARENRKKIDSKLPIEVLGALGTLEEFFANQPADFEVQLTGTVLLMDSVTDSEGKEWLEPVRTVLTGLEELMATGGHLTSLQSKLVEEQTQKIHKVLYPELEKPKFDWDTTVTLARLMPEVFQGFWEKFWIEGVERHLKVHYLDAEVFTSEFLEMEESGPYTEKVVEKPERPVRTDWPPESSPVTPEDVPQETVRIDAEHLNSFTQNTESLAGQANYLETLVREARKALSAQLSHELREGMDHLQHTMGSFQETLMMIRASRMSELFERLPRMIRKLEKDLNRKVDLEIKGETLEVDRSVVHALTAPLLHLVRNALDHGIESPQDRKACGKRESGTLKVEAQKSEECLLLSIQDDGKGIDREKVLQKAIERGIVEKNQKLTEDEIYQLILQPGFSLAKKVSAVSGRGVGMDVVINTLRRHGGELKIKSTLQKGSIFLLKYPLRDNMRSRKVLPVEVGSRRYAVRQEVLREIVEIEKKDWSLDESEPDKEQIFQYQGRENHFVSLENLFSGTADKANLSSGVVLVLEDSSGQRIAFRVDRLLRPTQAAIKPFSHEFLLSSRWFEGSIVTGREPPVPVFASENLNVFL